MKGRVWIGRDDQYYVLGSLQKQMVKGPFGWEQCDRQGHYNDIDLCPRDFHRILPKIRLKPGARPIRVLVLGIPLDGLTEAQLVTLREEADALEALAEGMRGENGA